MKLRKKVITLFALIGTLTFFTTGCGGNKIKTGTYNGTTGQSLGEVSATLTFEKDGTCTYERIRNVSKGFGEGSEEVTETFSGVWSETEQDNTYEIRIDGIYDILSGMVSDSGDIVISSNGNDWKTETFTKE